jgi:hypothetical protein
MTHKPEQSKKGGCGGGGGRIFVHPTARYRRKNNISEEIKRYIIGG